ncbi:MAG: APC family permease, partial [Persicimonas sp.]
MKTLKKNLGLFDIYAISTGAMFSSGFFLLPGIAAAQTGPSVVLAYFLAGLMIVPPMLNLAELSTAMPRAGGSYYFVDRALGPLFGTVAGLGTWVALVLKSAFALIGMGAYLAFFFDVPIVPLALALTVVFCVLNLYGSKKSGDLQRWLVTALVGILSYFVVEGVLASVGSPYAEAGWRSFESFAIEGFDGVIATAGLVFVSYAGLTGVTGVAEEVERPDRNIPLGMILSLMTATVIYCLGVYVMSATLEPSVFYGDMTPVATSSQAFMEWLPASIGLMLVVVSAIAAFASTGNAGILSASRYPLAMARDNLVPAVFTKISAHGTPARAIILTGAVIALCLVTFD